MTLHRAENVDDKKILIPIIRTILNSSEDFIFPVHPRTIKRLQEFKLYEQLTKSNNVLLLESVGYFEMLELMKKCLFIVTDSGGIQEEATSEKIRKKVLVLRKTTDRPEAVSQGFSELIGTNPQKIDLAIKKTLGNLTVPHKKSPFGNGHASEKIVSLIKKNL
jgi:UDP-N-acetylglucosamine 2-epimerase (non-hydrolysing)